MLMTRVLGVKKRLNMPSVGDRDPMVLFPLKLGKRDRTKLKETSSS
jgi:hypothetical protein